MADVPEDVVETFQEWLGCPVDRNKIVLLPSNGKDLEHGNFEIYVMRREGNIYRVHKHLDGSKLEFH